MRPSMQLKNEWKTWMGVATAVLGALAVGLSYTPGLSITRRAPTEYETVLYQFAQEIGETALCDQMSW